MATTAKGAGTPVPARRSGDPRFQKFVRHVQRWVGAAALVVSVVLLTGVLLTLAEAQRPPLDSPAAVSSSTQPMRVESQPASAPTPIVPAVSEPPISDAKVRRHHAPAPLRRVRRPDDVPDQDSSLARIRIPALGIDRRPVGLGVLGNGSLAAPRRYRDIGWWEEGPSPGAGGNAVVVGHVDSKTGPAVFYGLASLQIGDHIALTRREGTTVRFDVRRVARFPLAEFPAERVYRRGGPPGLVLITCGGKYDQAVGRYLDNVVVFASPLPHRSGLANK